MGVVMNLRGGGGIFEDSLERKNTNAALIKEVKNKSTSADRRN